MRVTQARIHLGHLEHNLGELQKISPKVKMCLAIKANAYGHGAVPIAERAIKAGVSFLSVATIFEGAELRRAGIDVPILLLSVPSKEEIPAIILERLTPLVCDIEFIDLLDRAALVDSQLMGRYPVHLKIDSGMGRLGCRPEKGVEIALYIQSKKNLYLEGVCTHLSVSDSLKKEDIVYTNEQIAVFERGIGAIKRAGIDTGIVHCVASGGILMYPHAHFDMIRPGILAYGYYPSVELFEYFKNTKKPIVNLKPVMELVTSITSIKTVYPGECISYGRAWVADKKTKIATISIGYADGLLRKLSPELFVTIRNKKYPIVGRICMDQCMVDIGTEGVIERWDEVIIFSHQENCNTASSLARILDTIEYEVLCLVSERVCRTYVYKDN